MQVLTKTLSSEDAAKILATEESHFVDLKSARIGPGKLSTSVSAFANAGGGEIFVGVDEAQANGAKARRWAGFVDIEAANPIIQVFERMDPRWTYLSAEFLRAPEMNGLVLHITVFQTQDILLATDENAYVRRSAQSIRLNAAGLAQLKYDKGLISFEDEPVNVDVEEITTSEKIFKFLLDVVPTAEPRSWLEKQRVLVAGRPNVAGLLLYSDNPQAILPKRSAIKVLRYRTKLVAERDFLSADPETIEGPLYDLIYDAVDRIKAIIEGIEKSGPHGLERISYPEEALHELLTNAVLHRDYSVPADVQVRVFDNRVEIESPGRLPGHVTVENIARTQFARNPKIVRLINKFKNPPNKDVGEGINTALEAMQKLRLKKPFFEERDGSVIVTLRHESLASPQQIVMEFLQSNDEITNQIAREITGEKSESAIKQVFYKLRDAGQLEQVPKVKGTRKRPSWRKTNRGIDES
jgi:ATP-dependent DNA helicase RecG